MQTRFVFLALIAILGMDAQGYQGVGCTTALHIDKDCDGYGVGPGLTGPDADDNDSEIHSASDAKRKYSGGTAASDGLSVFFAHRGYQPSRYFYISPDGSDPGGAPNSPTAPFSTWAGLRKRFPLVAGDIVLFREGTYTEVIALDYNAANGSPTSPIIISAYPGEKPIINANTDYTFGATLTSAHDVIVDGFTITGPTGHGRTFFLDRAVNVTVRNNEVFNRENGVFSMQGLRNYLVEENVFHHTGTHCIYVGARDVPNTLITIRGNVLYQCGYHAIQHNGRIASGGLVIEGNIMHSTALGDVSLEQGVTGAIIRNNLMYSSGTTPMINIYCYNQDQDPNILPYDITDNVIENNTFWNGSSSPLGNPSGSAAIGADQNIHKTGYGSHAALGMSRQIIRNNIIYMTKGPVLGAKVNWIDLPSWTFENNLVYRSDGGELGYVLNDSSAYDFTRLRSYKSLAELQGISPTWRNNIYADPAFAAVSGANVDAPTLQDFNLLATSPAIRRATRTDAPVADIRGTLRGDPPDIGAYQFTSQTGTYPPSSPCDIDGSGQTDLHDFVLAQKQTLGTVACVEADLTGDGRCDVIDLQRVVTALTTGICQ